MDEPETGDNKEGATDPPQGGSGSRDRLNWKDPEALIAVIALIGVVGLVVWLASFVGDVTDAEQQWARALQVANGPGAAFLLILGGVLGFAVQSPRIKSEAKAKDEARGQAAQATQQAQSALATGEKAKRGILEVRTAAEEMIAARTDDVTAFLAAPARPLGRYLVEQNISLPQSDSVDGIVIVDEAEAEQLDPSLNRLLERIKAVEQGIS
jgi:hypothetical protein